MQTTPTTHAFPSHPNVVELAALLDDDRIKSTLRHSLQRALRDELRHPAHAKRPSSNGEPMKVAVQNEGGSQDRTSDSETADSHRSG